MPKKPKKTGPKTNWKLTDETVRKLEDAFAMDATIEEACFYADISHDTYHRWVKQNPKLSDKFTALRNKPILKARNAVVKSLDDPDRAFRYLERKRPAEFGTKTQLDHTGGLKIEIVNYEHGHKNTLPVQSGGTALPAGSAKKPGKIQVATYSPESGQDSAIDK